MQPNQIVCAWLGMGGHWLAGHLSRMWGQGSREPLLLGMAGLTRTLNLHITLVPTAIETLLLGGQGVGHLTARVHQLRGGAAQARSGPHSDPYSAQPQPQA